MSERNQWTGVLQASGVVTAKSAEIVGWTARVSSDSTITIYNGTVVGTDSDIITELDVLAADKSGGVMRLNAAAPNGLYVAISGNARVCVYYKAPLSRVA